MATNNHRRISHLSHLYFDEFTSRLVAKTGRPGDRFHLGKLIFQGLKDAPDFVLQIDGATNEVETFATALDRSTRCATALRTAGVGLGDVIVLMAPNHVHLSVPFYAALYLGVAVSPVDRTLRVNELQGTLNQSRPKAIFCQSEKVPDIVEALRIINLDARIITFDKGEVGCSLQEFMDKYGGDSSSAEFKVEEFDTEETIACLIPTSGSTGPPKLSAATHKNCALNMYNPWSWYDSFPTPTRLVFIMAPLQWLTALINFIGLPIYRITRLQSSQNLTPELFTRLVKTYEPTWMITSPTFLTQAMSCGDFDLRSFEIVHLGGSAVPQKLLEELKQLTPNTEFYCAFGMTEGAGFIFLNSNPRKAAACGHSNGILKYRIVNPDTGKTIDEPNVPGELWMKGPTLLKGYYKNPGATAEAFAEDGWFKTGDIFFRDEDDTYYFVDRLKLLLKYNIHQISPVEVEDVIRRHPGVQDTAVGGVPDASCGDLVVACVVRKSGSDVTAQEIKDHVKDNLTDSKQLRGGVIFLDQLPMTVSTKIDRRKLKEIILTTKRE